jgi:large repetitive protein
MSLDDFAEGARLRASGNLSRRKFMSRLVAGGMTASAAYAFLNATEGATAAAAPLSTAIVYGGAPSAPQSLTAAVAPVVGSGQVRLSWAPPSSNGGTAITGYLIQRLSNGTWDQVGTTAATTFMLTGLANGTTYSFRVLARNADGFTSPPATVNAVPRGVPSAPGALRAAPGNHQVTLSWLLPASNGAPITRYVVQRLVSGTWAQTGVTTARSFTVTGLSNGTPYSFRVLATNAIGNSAPSNPVNAVPRTVPSAPGSLRAVPGNGRVTLSWLLPASNGGSAVTDFVIQQSLNGVAWTTITDPVRTLPTHTVTGLTNGRRYYFRVLAKNVAGVGPASNVANAIPRTVPLAPVLRAAPRTRGALLTWTPPASNGGAAITRYVLQRSTSPTTGWVNVSTTLPASARSFTATGLRTGTRYYFRLGAVNAAGTGPWSTTNVVPQ